MKFSARTDWTDSPNALTQAVTLLRAEGATILDLAESNPTRCNFRYLHQDLLTAFVDEKALQYEPNPHGLLKAREAVCSYYAEKGILLNPDQIILTASTSEAYSFIFRLLANAGDSILAPQPSYPLLDYLAAMNDVEIVRYPLVFNRRWKIDFETFSQKIPDSARALLLVNPNNPTGHYVSDEERRQINLLARAHSLAIISDEVFFDFNLTDHSTPQSFAANQDALTFTISGISKVLGLPQMKFAWMVVTGPEALWRKAMAKLEIISDAYLSLSTPAQWAAIRWFERKPAIQGEILERLRTNLHTLRQALAGQEKIQIFPTEGGWTTVLGFPTTQSDEAWALHLLKEHHVYLHPGYFFDFSESSCLVLSLLVPPATFQASIQKIIL